MDVMSAAKETLMVAVQGVLRGPKHANFSHLQQMVAKMEENKNKWSYGKLCRWLGYMQGVMVATGCATLEEMVEINKRNRQDVTGHREGAATTPAAE